MRSIYELELILSKAGFISSFLQVFPSQYRFHQNRVLIDSRLAYL